MMFDLSVRIFLSFLTLLILTRIMGRKEISQMTFFNFVSAITIGTISGALITDPNFTLTEGIFSLVGWSLLTIVLGVIDIKFKPVRKLIEGEPLIVIKNGQIMEKALRKVRLDVDALNAMLREKEVFSLTEVEYAIFESDGKLSVMKKENKQNITKGDLNLQSKVNKYPIPLGIISDGKVNNDNLLKLDLNQQWLDTQLQQAGIQSVSDVFYAELQQDGTLYIDKRDDTVLH
jgi:uncharacterized membrane protein YcaP (DUF421 family)